MTTNKDRLEKLELEMQKLKEGIQEMSAESQSNFRELRELFSKSLERGEPSATKEKGHFKWPRKIPPDIQMDPRGWVVLLS
jgi:hypothetical protein